MLAKYTLKNGIPVFIVESSAAPVVSIQAWVSRGSAHEADRVAGISHFLEHALFKGTRHREVGEIALEIESHGGEINAFTSFEETAYYTTLASRYFDQGLDVIADAIQYPSFDPEEMDREREVIIEEIKRAHDSPGKMVATNLWKTLFANTPYGRPVLGFEDTVKLINSPVLRNYFKQNYHSRSVSLFVVGDVDQGDVLSLVRKKFSKMPAGNRSPKRRLKFPSADKIRVVPISRDIQQCQVQIGIPTPQITDPSIPALDLLCSAVGQGESSRLYQRVVKEKRLALDVSMGLVATGGCGIATLGLVASPERLEDAIRECMDVLWEVGATGLEEVELDRVKNSLESEVIAGKETVDGFARRLGYYYVQFGDPNYEKKYLDDLAGIELDDTTDAINGLLRKKPTLSLAHPTAYKPDKKALAATLSPRARKAQPKAGTELPTKVQRCDSTFIIKRVTHLPIVSLKLIFAGGSREEKPSQYGITNLFQRLWTAGTRSYRCKELAHILDSLGADISGFAGRNTHGLDVEFLSKQWPVIRPLLGEVLTEPTFPEEEFDTEKAILLKEIQSERDSPGQLCNLNFASAVYGDHPYGRSHLGTKAAVEGLTREDLKTFFKDYVHRGQLVVSSVGSFPHMDWAAELEPLIGLVPRQGKTCAPLAEVTMPTSPRLALAQKQPLFQTHVLVGFPGVTFTDPERYALKLLSSCLAGQGGRLFLELRDRQSLAYTVAPILTEGPVRGVFAFYIGCSPEKLARALKGIRSEIEKVIQEPLGAAELKRAKEYWIGRFELDLQRYGSQAALFGLDEYYGLGFMHGLEVPELIKNVTAEEILTACRKVLKVRAPIFSIVHNGPLKESEVLEAWESGAK